MGNLLGNVVMLKGIGLEHLEMIHTQKGYIALRVEMLPMRKVYIQKHPQMVHM